MKCKKNKIKNKKTCILVLTKLLENDILILETCTICKKMRGGEDMKGNVLKGKLLQNGKTYKDCADAIGVSVTTFSDKMNGKRVFSVEEANKLSTYVGLNHNERVEIFLT